MMTMKRMETVLKTLWWNKWISQPTSQTNDNTAAGNNTGIPLEDNGEVTEHVL